MPTCTACGSPCNYVGMTHVEGCSNQSCTFAGDYDTPWSTLQLQKTAVEMSLARKIFSVYTSHVYSRVAPNMALWPQRVPFRSMLPTSPREFDLVLSALVYAEDEVAVQAMRKACGQDNNTCWHTSAFNIRVLTAMAEHLINDLGALPGALVVSSVGANIVQDHRDEFSYVGPADPNEIDQGHIGTIFDGYAGRIPVYSDFYRSLGTQVLDADEIYLVGRPSDMGYFVETTPLHPYCGSVSSDFFVVCKQTLMKAVRV